MARQRFKSNGHHTVFPRPYRSEISYRTLRLYTGACILRNLRLRLGLGVPLRRVHPKLNQHHSLRRCSNHIQLEVLQARDQNPPQISVATASTDRVFHAGPRV